MITAFKLVQRLLKQKIILSRRDKVGVLLVGVDQARDPAKEDEDLECSSGVSWLTKSVIRTLAGRNEWGWEISDQDHMGASLPLSGRG